MLSGSIRSKRKFYPFEISQGYHRSIWRGNPLRVSPFQRAPGRPSRPAFLSRAECRPTPPCMPHQRRIHFSGLPLIRQGELRGLIHIIENLKCVSDSLWGRLPLGSLYERFPVASHGAYRSSTRRFDRKDICEKVH